MSLNKKDLDNINNLILKRIEDIQTRGENLSVFDKNGNITTLKKSSIWYDDNGNYVSPKPTESLEIPCIIM